MRESKPGATQLKRRHIGAVTIGNALEFYDFLIYALFAIQIGHAFFPSSSAYGSLMLSLATFGAGFLTRPVGSIVLGAYADRVGRKPAMLLCLALIGGSITVMALIPTYARIGIIAPILAVLARLIQGFSLGGEVGSNTAFLAEAASPERRGVVVSWQGASQLMALICGNLVGVLLSTVMSPTQLDAYGWRVALLLGAATVPFGLWLRADLPETLHAGEPGHATEAAERVAVPGLPEAAAAPGATTVTKAGAMPRAPAMPGTGARAAAAAPDSRLARRHWRVMALGLAALGAGTIGTYIFTYIATYAQHTLHLPARVGFEAELTSYLAAVPVTLLGGWLSDRFGRWPINVWSNAVFLVAIYPVFAWIVAADSAGVLIVATTLLSAASWAGTGPLLAALAEALPRSIRSTGFGTVYALAIATFGGTTQLVVTWLIQATGSSIAPAWYLVGATAVGQIALMLLPETAPVRQRRRIEQRHFIRA